MRFDNDEPPVSGLEVLVFIVILFLLMSIARSCTEPIPPL